MITPGSVIIGILFIFFGVLVFKGSDKWVARLVAMWSLKKFSAFEIKAMTIIWKLAAALVVGAGFLTAFGLIR